MALKTHAPPKSRPERLPIICWWALAALLASAAFAGPAWAQIEAPSRPFRVLLDEWDSQLTEAERYARQNFDELSRSRSEQYLRQARQIRADALDRKRAEQRRIGVQQRLLDSLGPPPAEDAPPELDIVVRRRQQYQQNIAELSARVGFADLIVARADELEKALIVSARDIRLVNVLSRSPMPLTAETMAKAAADAVEAFRKIARTPFDWVKGLGDEQIPGLLRYLAVTVILASVLAWLVRHLLRRFGRDQTIPDPSYGRRLLAAIAEALGFGIIPAFFLVAFLFQVRSQGWLLYGTFVPVLWGLLIITIFFVLVTALARAALSPAQPAWRLFRLSPDNARRIYHRILLLTAFFSLEMLMKRTLGEKSLLSVSDETMAWTALIFNIPQALIVLTLLPGALWRIEDDPTEPSVDNGDAEAEAEAEAEAVEQTTPGNLFWPVVRWLIGALAIVGIAAAGLGYTRLSNYLMDNLLLSGVTLGVFFILHRLFVELVELLLASAPLQSNFGIGERSQRGMMFWTRAATTLLFSVAGLYVAAFVWGVPLQILWNWTVDLFGDLSFGDITLSLTDVLLSLGVFVATLMITRIVQRALLRRVLPATRLATSAQHSIAAGTGYVGVILAGVLSVATLGIDMTNVALLAGALSVGIGFGLKTVANNFVSGLILLFERPIKVGDWVVLGDREGYVRNINIRSTEIETFDKAAVIVPNADMISNQLVNWTHGDLVGRIDIRIGVAYGSNLKKVSEILLDCARRQALVIRRAPFQAYVLFQDFGEHRLELELRCYTSDVNQRLTIASDLRYGIRRRLREAGIEMPLPQQVVRFARPAEEAGS